MRIKLRILLCLAVLSIIGAVFIVADSADEIRHKPEYTVETGAVSSDSGVFFMENWNLKGRLYRIGTGGEVLAITDSGKVKMDRGEQVAVFNGKVYAVYSSERSDKDGAFTAYRIVSYDMELDPTGVSDVFILEENLEICSLSADTLGVYITAVSKNGGSVSVFSLSSGKLKSLEALDDESSDPAMKKSDAERSSYSVPDALLYRERTTERFYVNACYRDSELSVLMDGDDPTGVFAPDIRVKEAVDSIHFTFGQNISLRWNMIVKITGIFLIWLILVILTVRLTRDRDRIVYVFFASEVVFFLILFLAFIFIRQQFRQNDLRNNTRYIVSAMQRDLKYYSNVDYTSADFYNSTKYYRLLGNMQEFVGEADSEDIFEDAFIMQKSTGQVLVDSRGWNRVHASYLYGGGMSSLIEQLNEGTNPVSIDLYQEGRTMRSIAYESENPRDDLAVVAVLQDQQGNKLHRSSMVGLGVLFIVIFIIGSLLLFVVLYLQHVDLKRFSHALKGLALDQEKEESPKNVSRDMRELWKSYGELSKRIEEINYDKYMIFEAYYRFAPKGIEEILGKDSILDVRNGDVVDVSGSMVLLSIDQEEAFEKKVRSLSGILTNMEKYAKQNEGILVSRDPSLSNIRFLLLKEAGDTVSQIVQSIHVGKMLEVTNMSVLMYKDRVTYGVVGSSNQSLTYIDSEFSKEMDAYAAWFRKLGASVVVTDSIVSAEDVGENRYVGCAYFKESGNEVRFYEVLDAYNAKTRQLMLINREKFEKTIDLFYSKDYYLARNQFMEILRDCPEDGMVKWYIFECEKYMNGQGDLSLSAYIQLENDRSH